MFCYYNTMFAGKVEADLLFNLVLHIFGFFECTPAAYRPEDVREGLGSDSLNVKYS